METATTTLVAIIFALGFYGITVWALVRTRRQIGRSALAVFRYGRAEEVASVFAMWAFPLVLIASTWWTEAPAFRLLVASAALRVAGTVLLLGGLALMATSIATLGPAFRIGLDPEQRAILIRRGVYAYVRHPIYTSFLGFYAGAWLLQPNALFSILTPLAMARIVLQALREERMLAGAFGRDYEAYMKATTRFIPGIV